MSFCSHPPLNFVQFIKLILLCGYFTKTFISVIIEKGRKAFGNGVLPAKGVLTKRLLIAFFIYRKSVFLNLEKFILENLALEKGEGVGAIIPSDITPPLVSADLINDILLTGTI